MWRVCTASWLRQDDRRARKRQCYAGLLPSCQASALLIGTAHAEVSEADREFINKAAMSGQAEVASGETAAQQNSAIADFGNQMVREHGAMN